MEHHRRTAITRVAVSDAAAAKLERVITRWKEGCQIATNVAWEHENVLTAQELQSAAYNRIREETGLKSEHTLLAIRQALEAVRSCREQGKSGRSISKPEFTAPTVRYDKRTMTLFDDGTVSLTTLSDRVRCPLVLPEDDEGYQYQFLDDDSWELARSSLTYRDGDYYLHLGFRRPVDSKPDQPEEGTVLGVDLGIENLAVTSTAQFFSGRELAHIHREFERRRQALQENGSRSARRTLNQMSTRERRYTRDLLHRISAALIKEAQDHDCTTIVFEDLTNIREEIPDTRQFHVWAFRRLRTFVEYKAAIKEIRVDTVNPSHTSQRCSRIGCGHITPENRPSRQRFRCQECGYEANADYNAAKNIALKYVRRGLRSSGRTGTGQCALNSGTLSPERGFTDKSPADGES